MSNKNIAIPKYKWESSQQPKLTSSNTLYKDDRKIHVQYSPKSIPNQIPKYFKQNAIYRHASQQQFKRYTQPTPHNGEYQPLSAEEEYYTSHHKNIHEQNIPNPINLPNLTNPIPQMPQIAQLSPVNRNLVQIQTQQPQIQNNMNPYSSYSSHTTQATFTSHSSRNYMKEQSSPSSIDHNTNHSNRRVSPNSSPAFFKSKPKLIIKEQLPQQQKINIDCFKKLTKLGQGKFGKVYLVRQINTGFIMALKVLEKKKIMQDNILEQFIRELKIQAFLNHPNIIDVYGFFHDQTYFYTMLELGCDGQLYNIIAQHKNLTQEATSFITKNLLGAVHCMHENHILHRDIKPQNIVLIMGNVKLCDFGWAVNKVTKQELRSTFCGTPLYLSPQLLKGQRYDQKVDLWAIGILAYELLIGCSPFQIVEQQDLLKILTQQVKFPKNKKISPQFQQFIQHILNKNPKERLPSSELLRLPFIKKYQEFQTCEELCG